MRQFDEFAANTTYWRIKPFIDSEYQKGDCVALDENGIVDHDLDFEQLYRRLTAIEKAPDGTLVVRSGMEFAVYWNVFPLSSLMKLPSGHPVIPSAARNLAGH